MRESTKKSWSLLYIRENQDECHRTVRVMSQLQRPAISLLVYLLNDGVKEDFIVMRPGRLR